MGDLGQAPAGGVEFERGERLAHGFLYRRAWTSSATCLQPNRRLPGLVLVEEAISPDEERAIAARIDAAPLTPFQFGQWEGKRLTINYGSGYDYQRGALADAPPLPVWLEELRERLAPRVGIDPGAALQALLIRYDPAPGSVGIATARTMTR